jgi:amino acid adenylation domain-containing protein
MVTMSLNLNQTKTEVKAQSIAEHRGKQTLFEAFEQQAIKTPDKIAFIFETLKITYQHLNDRANLLARYLSNLGVAKGSRVGICCDRSSQMIVSVLAVLKVGATYVPIDPDLPLERIALMVEDTQIQLILTKFNVQPSLTALPISFICVDAQWEEIKEAGQKESVSKPTQRATPDDIAYIVYTSGSTGKPKGVPVRHRSVLNIIHATAKTLDFQEADVVFASCSFIFDISVLDIFLPLTHGGTLVMLPHRDRFDMNKHMVLIEQENVTMLIQGPMFWRALIEAGWQGKPNMRIISSAEHLPQSLVRPLLQLGCGLWNAYGPSETTIFSSIGKITTEAPLVQIGHPADLTAFYILDEALQPVAYGEEGELYISGIGINPEGYLNRPELSQEKFLPNTFSADPVYALMYRTGDRVKQLEDGTYQYLGRLDFQVKIRGYRIELGELETVLEQHPSIRQAVVIHQPAEKLEEHPKLFAFVKIETTTPVTPEDIKDYISQKLPHYFMPSFIIPLLAFPQTPTGKVDRKKLEAQKQEIIALHQQNETLTRQNQTPYAAATTPLEEQLVAYWQSLLSFAPIGIDDDFFALGGGSLQLIQLVTYFNQTLKLPISVEQVMNHSTIRKLSSFFHPSSRSKYSNIDVPFVSFNNKGSHRPLFGTHPLPDIARSFSPERPFYGLSQTYIRQTLPLENRDLAEVVNLWLQEIKRLQPTGPYNLMGYCARAPIAWELARVLEAEGHQVTLILFDPSLPPPCLNAAFLLYSAMIPNLRFKALLSQTNRKQLKKRKQIRFAFKQPYGANYDRYQLKPETRQRLEKMVSLQADINRYFYLEDLAVNYPDGFSLQPLQASVYYFLSHTIRNGPHRFYLRDIETRWRPLSKEAHIELVDVQHVHLIGHEGAPAISKTLKDKLF